MKFLIIFALVLATASAFDLPNANIEQRNLVVPAAESEGRITNGQDAAVGQFPYQVYLRLKFNHIQESWCGGSIISKNWILTAAHCTDRVEAVIAYLGSNSRLKPETNFTIPKSDIIIHLGWNRATGKNDISLIKTPNITFSNNIQVIKLPAISSNYSSYVGETVIASGWGRKFDNGTSSDHLQWAPLDVILNAICARYYGSVTSTNLCVSTRGGTSTCKGDSGGPVVLESSQTQIGLVSFGHREGCTKDYPAVYTRVTSYLEWIRDYTGVSY